MTIRPKQLALAVAAAMSGGLDIPAQVFAAIASSQKLRVSRGYTYASSRNGGRRHTVAQDKRAARKARNRARARRRFT
jgi:hypothetical protein